MSEIAAIVGPPGSGKSASMRTLDPEETFIVSCIGKAPPFPGWADDYPEFSKENTDGHYFELDVPPRQMTDKLEWVMKAVSNKRDDIKVLCIDDFQYTMSFEFMDRALESGWDKFSEMGVSVFDVIDTARRLRDDLIVVFLTHSAEKESASHGMVGIKTIGKMIDKNLDMEGLFNLILFATSPEPGQYKFLTETDGERIARTPMGMFDKSLVDNDLGAVIERLREYNSR